MGALCLPYRSRVVGYGVNFDGVNEYGSMGNILAYERTQAFTLACLAVTYGTGYLIAKVNSVQVGYALQMIAGGQIDFFIKGATAGTNNLTIRTNAGGLNNGRLQLIVGTYNASSNTSGMKLYTAGALAASTSISNVLGTSIVSTDALNIGARTGGSAGRLAGNIVAAAIWNKELSAAEVTTIWNGGMIGNWASIGPIANLAGYWAPTATSSFASLPDLSSGGHTCTLNNTELGDIVPVRHWELRAA